jgi:hypothetical protein
VIFRRYKKLIQEREDTYKLMSAVKDSDQDPEIISLHLSNLICEVYHLDKIIKREMAVITISMVTAFLILSTILFTLIKLL